MIVEHKKISPLMIAFYPRDFLNGAAGEIFLRQLFSYRLIIRHLVEFLVLGLIAVKTVV